MVDEVLYPIPGSNPLFWVQSFCVGLSTGSLHYSEGSLFRSVVFPKVCYSEGPSFRRVVFPKDRYSKKFKRVVILKERYSETNHKGRYSKGSLFQEKKIGIKTLRNNDPLDFFRNNGPSQWRPLWFFSEYKRSFGITVLRNNDPSE